MRALLLGWALAASIAAPVAAAPSKTEVAATMKRATRFMVETVATNGGYVWSYLPDMSRRWGEMEAFPTMIWVQPPGTATMGHLYLDAYHATGDAYYYEAATKAADALVAIQQDNGGWHYFGDFGGEVSTRRWYDTIGKNAWRLEEFQHYWGNATFDDAGTSESMQFLLRLYVERHDPKYLPALRKALTFVLDSQYPIGGWPQRFPLRSDFSHHGKPDYTSFITFNDDVAGENIQFLLYAYQSLGGDARIYDAIVRAMNVYLVTQQAKPQAGWGLQYTLDLKPVGARTYEPTALVTHTTAANVRQLFRFYRLTGDKKFLARVPEALDWLDSVRLPADQVKGNRAYPTFIEIGTNRPLYVHRRGSNVVNGEYYVDYDPANTITHYSSTRAVDVPALRREYRALIDSDPAVVTKDSPLRTPQPLPRYFLVEEHATSDLNTADGKRSAEALVRTLNAAGWWPTELKATSNPYAGDGATTPVRGDFSRTKVGDATDTSPYETDHPVVGISTGTYIENMKVLIAALRR
ncbi:pectate lyase [Sphingomonas psychrotolerans]|uniref:Pectate lyase n=1 Tax=Sphingomonas psychrotolerans TaxID=1327635 RepID=A0ABU3N173_9SPHN|nr:pectate lyase [Sphingomonas psychrotolerans]MDT8758001.1 pectate lyase [Sphingomonas psychrotolerans]